MSAPPITFRLAPDLSSAADDAVTGALVAALLSARDRRRQREEAANRGERVEELSHISGGESA